MAYSSDLMPFHCNCSASGFLCRRPPRVDSRFPWHLCVIRIINSLERTRRKANDGTVWRTGIKPVLFDWLTSFIYSMVDSRKVATCQKGKKEPVENEVNKWGLASDANVVGFVAPNGRRAFCCRCCRLSGGAPLPPPQPARPPSGRAPCRCHLFLARSKRSHAIKYRSGRLTRWANFNDSPALFFGGSHDDKRPFNWILHHSTGGDGPRCWIPSELPAVVDLVFRRKYSITTLANDVARTASHVMAGSTTVWGGFLSLRPLSPIINQIWSERPMYGAGDPNPFIRCVETRRKTALPRPTSLDPRTRIDGRP